MLTLRPSQERGHADHGWLNTYHSFSFADYYDPRHMGFSLLRVINEDFVAPGQGFGTHPHRDMEIITVILEGTLEHKDSMGNQAQIKPGEVQRMSAGTGVTHSEFNPSPMQPVHLMQIWIETGKKGIAPSYEQKAFPESEKLNQLRLVASPDGRDGSVTIHTDASLYQTLLRDGATVTQPIAPGRRAYVHVARGEATLHGRPLQAGDGARVEDEAELRLEASKSAEVLVFDLP
ncbi:MAG: pirin family protein [Candidatus Sericytochromatia bacterium]